MKHILQTLCLALLAGFSLQAQGSDGVLRPSEALSANVSSEQSQQVQSPKEFLEACLNGKVVKLEKDPSDQRRAVLSVERKGSITQHVLEVVLNAERELQEVRIVTTEGRSSGIPPVIVMPLPLASKCWSQCKEKCGQATECRVGCLLECLAS